MGTLNGWDVVDANNDDAPPDGWPENTMNYSDVNDTGRAVQGTLKRYFADINGSLVGGGVADAYTVTLNETGYTAYFTGMIFKCSIPAVNLTTTPTINVNAIGAVTIVNNAGGAINIAALSAGGVYEFIYDGTDMRVAGGLSGVGGADTEMQYNNGNEPGGTSEFTYNDSLGTFSFVNNTITNASMVTMVANALTTAFAFNIDIGDDGNLTGGGGLRVLGPNAGGDLASGLITVNTQNNTPSVRANSSSVDGQALAIYSNAASRTEPLVFIENDQATGNGGIMVIQQDQGGIGIDLDINNITTTNPGIRVDHGSQLAPAASIDINSDFLMRERSDHAVTPAAGFSLMWVRDGDPTELVHTDDTGVDHILTGELIIKSADESKTNDDTPAADSELNVSLDANSFYEVHIEMLFTSTSSSPDFQITFDEPDGFWNAMIFIQPGAGGTLEEFGRNDGFNGVLGGTINANEVSRLTVQAFLRTGGSGGTFGVEWAQLSSQGVATTVQQDSYLRAVKIQ